MQGGKLVNLGAGPPKNNSRHLRLNVGPASGTPRIRLDEILQLFIFGKLQMRGISDEVAKPVEPSKTAGCEGIDAGSESFGAPAPSPSRKPAPAKVNAIV